jgi:hypothetical protein
MVYQMHTQPSLEPAPARIEFKAHSKIHCKNQAEYSAGIAKE